METMRCFGALDLAADVIDGLREVQGELKERLAGPTPEEGVRVKWVSPASMHLTLKFLGDKVDVGVTPALQEALAKAARRRPVFDLQVRGVGAFPKPGAARILWAGLDAPDDLAELHEAVEQRLEDVGLPRERRRFSPHVTLGRVRDRKATPDLTAALEGLDDREFGGSPVNSLVLYRSTLTPKGPRYEALARAQLKRSNPPSHAETRP